MIFTRRFGALAARRQFPDSPELQRELLRRGQDIPIVYITAHTDDSIRPRLIEQGAVECLFKPFSESALLAAVEKALRMNS